MIFKHIKQLIIDDNNGKIPLYQVHQNAKIVIIGQAPGLKSESVGQCFRDRSGDILRSWLNLKETQFYSKQIAILPMDFYYPGKGKVGDLPPRKDFAAKWHTLLLKQMPQVKLIILVGNYSQKYYLGKSCKNNLTMTVKHFNDYLPDYFPITIKL